MTHSYRPAITTPWSERRRTGWIKKGPPKPWGRPYSAAVLKKSEAAALAAATSQKLFEFSARSLKSGAFMFDRTLMQNPQGTGSQKREADKLSWSLSSAQRLRKYRFTIHLIGSIYIEKPRY